MTTEISSTPPNSYFSKRWQAEAGYRQILNIALPLIFGSAFMAIQQFINRIFLAWYSAEAVAASMPAGIISFTFINLFIGTAGYSSTFVAQYFGAERNHRIGPVIWQGLYISVFAGVFMAAMIPLATPFFRLVGHAPEIQQLEVEYFRIICIAAFPNVAIAVLTGFFTGRGITKPILVVGTCGNLLSVFLNYTLVFGNFGFPELGVRGAATATVISSFFVFSIFWIMILPASYDRQFRILSGWIFDLALLKRLLRYGLPNGLQYFINFIGFSVFLLFIGRLGTIPLAATNITFNINMLAFMPMMGFSMAIMIKVGQYQGKNRSDLASYSVYSGFHLTSIYMIIIAACYFLIPRVFLWPFAVKADPASFDTIMDLCVVLLRFVTVYSLFDTLSTVFSAGVKAAGDTKFVMIMGSTLAVALLAIPSYVALVVFEMGLYTGWSIVTVYISANGIAYLIRFLTGKWKTMQVIEVQLDDEKGD
jgi:multidrug resistance protein, MATE family